MTKVAVGVRVKCDNEWATIKEVLPNGRFLVEWDEHGPGAVPWRESDFHFDQPNDPRAPLSPIVTVRRLEPGVYGRLIVTDDASDGNGVGLKFASRLGGELGSLGAALSAPELRELARVALEIAEYLDGLD